MGPLWLNDADETSNIHFVVESTSAVAFGVDIAATTLLTAAVFDAETEEDVEVKLIGSDGQHMVWVTFTVHILDVNDHRPEFVSPHIASHFYDTDAAGHTFLYLRDYVSDQDREEVNRRVRFVADLSSLPEPAVFAVNSSTGEVTLNQALFLPGASYIFTAIAINTASPHFNATAATFNISVQVGNRAPHFEQPVYAATIKESAHPGDFVLHVKADALDIDPLPTFTYALSGPSPFVIDTEGRITVAEPLDADGEAASTQYMLRVLARDATSPSLFSSANITILVEDVDDNTPQFDPEQPKVAVNRSAPGGTFITRLNIVDADATSENRGALFSLVEARPPAYRALFQVDGASGDVHLNPGAMLWTAQASKIELGIRVVAARDPEALNNPSGSFTWLQVEIVANDSSCLGRCVGGV